MKRTVYLLCSMLLGVLLSFLLHVPLVTALPADPACASSSAFSNALCLFPAWARLSTILVGAIGGHFLGKTWWRIVYVEHRHWSYRNRS